MPDLVFYILVFLGLGAFFLFIHLVMGKFIRPLRPEEAKPGLFDFLRRLFAPGKPAEPIDEKLTIYECGEPTVGSAWIQFDVRYYVVALLFVIFDVEVAFFFPWAVVFGSVNDLSKTTLDDKARIEISQSLIADPIPAPDAVSAAELVRAKEKGLQTGEAKQWAWIAFFDIIVFFGVLMVGFAYLWRRGDIDWVRSTAAERAPPQPGI